MIGHKAARAYADAGFRILPTKDRRPRPGIWGWSVGNSTYTHDPKDFKDDEEPGILCGPTLDGKRLTCIDLDGDLTLEDLRQCLALPDTLMSRNRKHLWYYVPADVSFKGRIGLLNMRAGWDKAKGKAPDVDIKWDGGYAREAGDWEGGFDPARIADLSAELAESIDQLQRSCRPVACYEPSDVQPPQGVTKEWAQACVSAIAAEMPTQGRHEFAMALGGVLRREGVPLKDAVNIVFEGFKRGGSTDPDTRTKAAEDAWDRADSGQPAYGWPKLQEIIPNGDTLFDVLENVERPAKREATPIECWADIVGTPVPPLVWICEGMKIAAGRPSFIVSGPNVGKSWGVQTMAVELAAGLPVFGEFECVAVPVMFLTQDSCHVATRERFQLLQAGLKVQTEIPLHWYKPRVPMVRREKGMLVYDPKGVREVTEAARARGCKVVFLDSLFALTEGLDPNAPDIGAAIRDTNTPDMAWIWTHHTGKHTGEFYGSQTIAGAMGVRWDVSLADETKEGGPRLWVCGKKPERISGPSPKAFHTEWLDYNRIAFKWVEGFHGDPKSEVRERMLAGLTKSAALGLNQTQLLTLVSAVEMRKVDKLAVLQELVDRKAVNCGKAGKSMVYTPGHFVSNVSESPETT